MVQYADYRAGVALGDDGEEIGDGCEAVQVCGLLTRYKPQILVASSESCAASLLHVRHALLTSSLCASVSPHVSHSIWVLLVQGLSTVSPHRTFTRQ